MSQAGTDRPQAFMLGESRLTTADLRRLSSRAQPEVAVSADAWRRLDGFRARVDGVLAGERRVYGINTGFGFLSDVAIPKDKLSELQANLVRSHACGVGEPVSEDVVRAVLVLRAHTFLLGHSGVRREVIDQVLGCLRHDILPVIPCQGSVGASGDLAPLSHLALGLLGEGDVRFRGETVPAARALEACGMRPLALAPKEGLALINGTHFMTAVAALAVEEARRLVQAADIGVGLSLDAVRGSLAAFDARIHAIRPHAGQSLVAGNIRTLFAGEDAIMLSHADCGKVQDPYSFRCVPQVHGACRDAIEHVRSVVDVELNSVTDNPLVFEDGDVLSGGNFHGEPVALVMDYLAMALAEIGSISERRTEKLTNPQMSGLPAFIIKDGGLNSGYMIPHVVTAALVSENKIHCHPASVDSIPTSADKEDHVSMGPIAARKARLIARNVSRILAIEYLAASQGIDLLAPLKPGAVLSAVHEAVRTRSPYMERDRSLHKDIEVLSAWILGGGPSDLVRARGCELV